MTLRLAVTGASGFVGGAVCRGAVEAGHQVLAFGRRAQLAPDHVAGAPYTAWDIVRGPLESPPAVDAVIHCAGSVTDWGPASEIGTVNVTGTRAVLAAFPAPTRFVHVSTASVYDALVPTVSAREDEAVIEPRTARNRDVYSFSKAHAESVVATTRSDAVILRPHAVYGRGDTTLLPRILDSVRGSRLFAVGDGHQRLSLTSVDNLVQACLLAATVTTTTTTTEDVSGIFNVTDAEPVVLDDALRAVLAARGIAAKPYYLPYRVAFSIAVALEAAAHLTRRPPRLTRYAVRHVAVERTLDISAAREQLGYDPAPTSFDGAADW